MPHRPIPSCTFWRVKARPRRITDKSQKLFIASSVLLNPPLFRNAMIGGGVYFNYRGSVGLVNTAFFGRRAGQPSIAS